MSGRGRKEEEWRKETENRDGCGHKRKGGGRRQRQRHIINKKSELIIRFPVIVAGIQM